MWGEGTLQGEGTSSSSKAWRQSRSGGCVCQGPPTTPGWSCEHREPDGLREPAAKGGLRSQRASGPSSH